MADVSGTVTAIGGRSGNVPWTFDTADAVEGGVAVASGTVYVASADETLYALDADSGELQWSFSLDGPAVARPAVDGGVVYVVTQNGRVSGIQPPEE